MRLFISVIFLTLLTICPAKAEWHEASTDHFVVYADQSEKDVKSFASQLELYHAALHSQLPQTRPKISPSNRVTVYVVRNREEVRKLFLGKEKNIGGFYVPRAGGSFAIVPKIDSSSLDLSETEQILLHEYAHHYMFSLTDRIYPLWFTEGFAEFYSTAKFDKDGSVGLGLPANHRGAELVLAKNVSLERLLDTSSYLAKKTQEYDEFYGKSWLLFHYLKFSKEREGQFSSYLKKLAGGVTELEAAKQSFGDLKQLEKELDRYLMQRKMSYIKIAAPKLPIGPIAVRKLGEGEAAMMPIKIVSKRGVTREMALELLPKARAVAAKYPKDAAVMTALSEAEFDAGNPKEAIAAADIAIAADQQQINAHLQKAYAMASLAPDAVDPEKDWLAVRRQFLKVNKLEADHPVPLIQFYLAFKGDGKEPSKNAVDGLEWALELAPYDPDLRMLVAEQQMSSKRYGDAVQTLEPLANSGHGSPLSITANEKIQIAKAKLASTAPDNPATTAAPK
jgi:tetratricopeptide (TPR) repeat protein